MALVVKSNPAQGTAVLVADMGSTVPPSGGSLTFTDDSSLELASVSKDLARLATDNAHGGGSSTLILNDGVANVAQANVAAFLSTVALILTGPYSVVARGADNRVAVFQISGTPSAAEDVATVGTVVVATQEPQPMTYRAVFDRLTPALDKYLANIWNGTATRKVVIQRVWYYDWQVALVTGVALEAYMTRVTARTAGTAVTPLAYDTADVLTAGIVAETNPTAVTAAAAPAFGRAFTSTEEINYNNNNVGNFTAMDLGALVYERKYSTKGIVLRQNQGFALRQVTNSNVGTVSVAIEFTDEAL